MHGRHSVTTRAWLFRCLLTLLTLAGLGLLQTAHCADRHDSSASSTVAAPDSARVDGPDTAAGTCRVAASTALPARAPATAATTPPAQAAGPRTADVALRPVPRAAKFCPALTEIGISRT